MNNDNQVVTVARATIADVRHQTAAVNGTRLHYVTAGDQGTPVLLVHGFPETWWAFRKLIPLLAARHRVYAVDLRGFGDSDVAEENYCGAVAAEDLRALIEHLSVGPVHVVGQDVSGGVVYRLAATHPENVISLTAIETALAGFGAERLANVTNGGAWYIGALAAPGIADLLFEREARAFIGEYLYPLYGVPATAVSPADVTEFARTYGRPGGFSGAAGLYRSMLTEGEELRALAKDKPLQLPVTTIGSRGGDFTYTAFREVTTREVTALRLDGVGHYVAQQAPHLLADRLLEALSRSIAAIRPLFERPRFAPFPERAVVPPERNDLLRPSATTKAGLGMAARRRASSGSGLHPSRRTAGGRASGRAGAR